MLKINDAGFTLIESVIVIAIIGILISISYPIYHDYYEKTKIHSCTLEIKNYVNNVYYVLHDEDDSNKPESPYLSSCQFITDASGWTIQTQKQYIYAIPKSVDHVKIQCDLNAGMSCKVMQN